MTLTHLPTRASIISNQTFGFVSGAEGFIFLAGFMIGQLETRIEQKNKFIGTIRDLVKRTWRVYVYHAALLAITFTVFASIAVHLHRESLQNLLSFYFHAPRRAVIAALLLKYRPSLLDILPMYVIFLVLTPVARYIAQRWSWDPIVYASFALWAMAQFGLRHWLFTHSDLFGLRVPEDSTGAFDMYAWQLLWMTALTLGSLYSKGSAKFPGWLLPLSFAVAGIFLVLRYSPTDHWIDRNVYGWLIDKWHLGPARVLNFSAILIVLVRYGARLAALPIFQPLASLGQASIEVFSVHVLCCYIGDSLSPNADPQLSPWQQILLLCGTISALFVTARIARKRPALPHR
jgi:hypothetical protein